MIPSHILPTVKVVDEKAPDGWKVINESDLCDDHRLWKGKPVTEPSATPSPINRLLDEPRVVKGARGKFYVKRGNKFLSGGFVSEQDAQVALEAHVTEMAKP